MLCEDEHSALRLLYLGGASDKSSAGRSFAMRATALAFFAAAKTSTLSPSELTYSPELQKAQRLSVPVCSTGAGGVLEAFARLAMQLSRQRKIQKLNGLPGTHRTEVQSFAFRCRRIFLHLPRKQSLLKHRRKKRSQSTAVSGLRTPTAPRLHLKAGKGPGPGSTFVRLAS